jgi:hypothetical protein
MEWIGSWLLNREIRFRIDAFAGAIDNTDILERLAALEPEDPPEIAPTESGT